MDDGSTPAGASACPHINRNDHRCGNRFTLTRLDQAFSVCLGSYVACPMYHRINGEMSRQSSASSRRPAGSPFIAITTNGCNRTLRATGT